MIHSYVQASRTLTPNSAAEVHTEKAEVNLEVRSVEHMSMQSNV